MVGVRFLPGAFFKLFKIPAYEFYNMLVDLEIVGLGIRTPELFPFGYSSIETVIIQLEEFISKRLNSCILDPISDELVHNARQLNFNHSVLEHYSSKTLNRRLKERCGVGQGGTFKNIVRFINLSA